MRETARPAVVPKLSVNEKTTYRWTLDEDVSGYQQAGIAGIGVWRPKLVDFGEEQAIDLLRDSPIAVSSLSWAGGFTSCREQIYDAMHDAADAVRLASQLGADCLRVISGPRAGHTHNHARRLVVDALTRLGDFAAGRGVQLALQPMHRVFGAEWSFLNSLDDTLEVLDACDHPNVKMSFDVYHLWQEDQLLPRIAEVAPRVATVQLSDWQAAPRSEMDRSLPGTGQIPIGDIVEAFIEGGYDGFFEIEIWSEVLWNSDYAEMLKFCRSQFQILSPA